jgi:hypothetical protein
LEAKVVVSNPAEVQSSENSIALIFLFS